MFAQELGTLSVLLLVGAVVLAFMLRVYGKSDQTNDDILLPIFLVISVLLTRVQPSIRSARSDGSRRAASPPATSIVASTRRGPSEISADGSSARMTPPDATDGACSRSAPASLSLR